MRRARNLLVAPLLGLILVSLLAGISLAGGGHSKRSSRVGRPDAEKIADQRADAERWLDDRDDWGDDREGHRELREVAWRASGTSLEVDGGQNGGAILTGWGRDSIRVVARVQAQARSLDRARELARSVKIVNQEGRLTATGMDTGRHESWSVTFDVLAPRKTALRIEALNGPICVADMDSRMELETVNGPMLLAAVSGDVRARTENGPLSVSLTGARWSGAGCDASTTNGPVSLSVPRGYSCMLETGTINGPMDLGIPIVMQGRINIRHEHITTKLGSGGPQVRAVTTNGPAVVRYTGEGGSEEVEN
jgi:hypothetical protein